MLTGQLGVLVHDQKRAIATTSAPASNLAKHKVLAFLPPDEFGARYQSYQLLTQSVRDFGCARGCRDQDFGRNRRISVRTEVIRERIDRDIRSGLLRGSRLASRRGSKNGRVRREVGWIKFTRVIQGMWNVFSKTFLSRAMLRFMRAQ